MSLVDIGYVLLAPPTRSHQRNRGIPGSDAVTGVTTLDTNACEMYPSDNEFDYPGGPNNEPLAACAGDVKVFKRLPHVLEYRQTVLLRDPLVSAYFLRLNERSRQYSVFWQWIRDRQKAWLADFFFSEPDHPPVVTDLGWDIADHHGISVLHHFRVSDVSFDMNCWGLLDSFEQAEILGTAGNSEWEREGRSGHGPFIEWLIARVDL